MKTVELNGKQVVLTTDENTFEQNGAIKVYDDEDVSIVTENQELFLSLKYMREHHSSAYDIQVEITELSVCSISNVEELSEEIIGLY